MHDEGYLSATNFFCSIITPDDVLRVDLLFNKISRAPIAAKKYFERHCRDVRELEEFFRDNEYLFYLENKRVALFDEQYLEDSERTVQFFKEKLIYCGKPMDYMQLKLRYIEHAPRNVISFIAQFYPGRELKKFFKRWPDIFVLHKDHTVFLVEVDSVEFYKRQLKIRKGKKQYFLRFRGHIGQAEPHVQAYINRNFLGDEFQDFLRRNSHVFKLDDDGFVSLVSPE